jgi:ankyrin repeat protein
MPSLPAQPNLDHLKKQAKDLLRRWRNGDPDALATFRRALPAAAGRSDGEIAALPLRLHDAQSCVARAYGFASWGDLVRYVEAVSQSRGDHAARVRRWLELVYSGDVTGTGIERASPRAAARMLQETPGLAAGDLACAAGDEDAVRAAIARDPGWVDRPGGPLRLPPLVAVTHSSLLELPDFRARLQGCARILLANGADPNQRIGCRLPPASVEQPDDSILLSALYGAAGKARDPGLTKLLLDGGAEPNDGESLYHALPDLACTRLLLEGGARFPSTNAIYRVLDFDNVATLELLLRRGADPNEPAGNAPLTEFGTPLLWAIRRRRSRQHVEALLKAGADPRARTPAGVSACRLALQFGLTEVAALLREYEDDAALSEDEQFVAACARGDAAEARRIQARRPDLPGSLSPAQLRRLPDLVAEGDETGARVMVALGWPLDVRGGDWSASALNHAVFRGNAGLTRFLLEQGAQWTDEHGHGDNACGTLSWASCNQPVEGGDWAGCAQALLDHGLPAATRDPDDPERVMVGERKKRFSDEVTEVLLGAR